jgi:hypothetical protein
MSQLLAVALEWVDRDGVRPASAASADGQLAGAADSHAESQQWLDRGVGYPRHHAGLPVLGHRLKATRRPGAAEVSPVGQIAGVPVTVCADAVLG